MILQESISARCHSALGHSGKMISWSKSGYAQANPNNFVIFNANIACIEGKVWYGDIDITLNKENLQEIAKFCEETVYVLYEMDGRFDNEESPKLDRAAIEFYPDGTYKIREDLVNYVKGRL